MTVLYIILAFLIGYVLGVWHTDSLVRRWRRRQHLPYLPMCRVRRLR